MIADGGESERLGEYREDPAKRKSPRSEARGCHGEAIGNEDPRGTWWSDATCRRVCFILKQTWTWMTKCVAYCTDGMECAEDVGVVERACECECR